MACLFLHQDDIRITIPTHVLEGKIIYYNIHIKVGSTQWTVKRRNSEFSKLHEILVLDHCVEKDILPPKKLIGNKTEAFVEKRRINLETYLNAIYSYLKKAMPRELAMFLDLHIYDIHYILQDMAIQFSIDSISNKNYTLNPIQIYAITERLKQPCSAFEITNKKYDFSHVLDFVSRLRKLVIIGSYQPYFESNIYLSTLHIDLSCFKNIKELTISNYPISNINNMGNIRDTVTTLKIHNANIKNIIDLIMCEEMHKDIKSANDSHVWMKLIHLDLSYNKIKEIDKSIRLMPYIESLVLNKNILFEISNIDLLPRLSQLFLSCNEFSILPPDLHVKLGKIMLLDLSQNKLTSLISFSKLYCLETLDVSCNRIENIDEVKYIGCLPCLENLKLTGNSVSTIIDYRVKALEPFGKRSADIFLDNEKPNQKELDTISVLQALRIAKERKSHSFNDTDSPLFSANLPNKK